MSGKRFSAGIVFLAVTTGFIVSNLPMNTTAAQAQTNRTSFKFDFGPGEVAPGYIQVLPTVVYSKELGYGFEPGQPSNALIVEAVTPCAPTSARATSPSSSPLPCSKEITT